MVISRHVLLRNLVLLPWGEKRGAWNAKHRNIIFCLSLKRPQFISVPTEIRHPVLHIDALILTLVYGSMIRGSAHHHLNSRTPFTFQILDSLFNVSSGVKGRLNSVARSFGVCFQQIEQSIVDRGDDCPHQRRIYSTGYTLVSILVQGVMKSVR